MADLARSISANDLHVITQNFIEAAASIHTAMCLFDDGHHAQKHLNEALQSVLTGAEQCRKLHASGSYRNRDETDGRSK